MSAFVVRNVKNFRHKFLSFCGEEVLLLTQMVFSFVKGEEKTTSKTTSFSLSKEATSEHSKRGARFLVAPRSAQPISETDLEEFTRDQKEGKDARVAQVVGNALIVASFVVNWFRKRRRERKTKKKEDDDDVPTGLEEN